MKNVRTGIFVFVIGLSIGVGSVAGVLFLRQDGTTQFLSERTNRTQEAESLSVSYTTNKASTKSKANIDVPSQIEDLVFPKRTFAWKERIVSWVNNLTDDQILSWLEQSTDSSWKVPLLIRTELQTKLLQKLSITAPDRAIDFSLARDDRQQRYAMTNIVFQTWTHLDIDGAVARVKEMNAQDSRYFLKTILNTCDDLSLEQMREVAMEIGDESFAFTVYFQNIGKGNIDKPRETWYEIVSLANRERIQHMTSSVLSRVAVAWVEEYGIEVLDEIVSSISDDVEYSSTLYDILGVLSSNQPDKIFDFVMSNLGDRAVDVIQRSGITNEWVQKDPKGLLAKLGILPANKFRQSVLRSAVRQWAEINPREILSQLDVVPPGQRDYASSRAIEIFSRTSPTEAAQFILHLTDDGSQSRFARILISQWIDDDAKAAKEWVLGLPVSKPMRASLINHLAKALVRTDPRSAFELALQQPLDNDDDSPHKSIGDEVIILSRIADHDVQLAIEFLPKVRSGGKASAYTDVGITLVEQGNLHQALQLANHLDESEKSEFFQEVAMDWLWRDPKGLLREFDDFPTSSKSRIALAMTFSNRVTSYYTDEEIEELERHISEKDKKLLKQLQEIDLSNPIDEDFEKFYELHL